MIHQNSSEIYDKKVYPNKKNKQRSFYLFLHYALSLFNVFVMSTILK